MMRKFPNPETLADQAMFDKPDPTGTMDEMRRDSDRRLDEQEWDIAECRRALMERPNVTGFHISRDRLIALLTRIDSLSSGPLTSTEPTDG